MTPKQWRDMTIGKTYDIDKAYGAQCWDYFAYFVMYFGLPISTHCSLTGYVCDLWRLRNSYGYSEYFDYITDAAKLEPGDWVIWDQGSSHPYSHVAMYMTGPVELGQNQGSAYVTEKTTVWDMLGAFRFKGWAEIATGASDIDINGRGYALYRQRPNEKTVVFSAGLNQVAPIETFGAGFRVYGKISGANYFQMRDGQPDPVNTTYGDLSAPLNEVWTEVPSQDSTLYMDIEAGTYGDCTGIHVNPEHNVFSPAVVYPREGNYQYARMVGIGHVNTVSRYSFLIRFTDGTCAVGIAKQDSTPKQIAEDIKSAAGADLHSISFLDGGGSAQLGRWKDGAFEYVHKTDRMIPSVVAIIDPRPIDEIIEPEPDAPAQTETGQNEEEEPQNGEEPMSETKPQEQPEIVIRDDYKDPEPGAGATILNRIAALLSVKSLITIFLTVIFGMLVLRGDDLPDQFISIYTMCISFFFGYQFKKAERKE